MDVGRFLGLLLSSLIILVQNAGAGSMIGKIVFAVNAGGPAHVDTDGIKYEGDTLKDGIASDYGRRLWTIGRVDPEDAILYQTERYSLSTFGYDIPMKDDGDYVLVLKFSEVYFLHSARKVFDVLLNRVHPIVEELDIFKEVGHGTAHDEIVPFKITDKGKKLVIHGEESVIKNGVIRVEFLKGNLDNPKINAFYVLRGTSNEVPKLPPLEENTIADNESDEEFESEEPELEWEDEEAADELVTENHHDSNDDVWSQAQKRKRRNVGSPARYPDPYLAEETEWTSIVQVTGSICLCFLVFFIVRKIVQ